MSVLQITEEGLEPLRETSFEVEGIRERDDIQRMLRDQPRILEEGLFIVAEEYGDWEESSRRIDLLALDSEGRLVVIELKRSDQGSLMDLQAIRYAAMVANMTLKQAIDAHSEYLRRLERDDDDEQQLQGHLSSDDAETRLNTSSPRIILVSADFGKELTTSVLWLNEVGLDITCIKMQPYKSGDDLFLERSQVIPVPQATDYLVRLRDRETEASLQESFQVETSQGVGAFKRAIQQARDDQKQRLENLCEIALSLESEGLSKLWTRVGSYNTVLRIELPDSDRGLVYVYVNKAGYGYLQFGVSLFDSRAPTSKERIEALIGRDFAESSTLWELPDGFLEALRDAYREANG